MALDLNPSASETILEAAIRSLGVDLPLDYKDFLRASNGGAGFVGDTYLHLWKAEELKPLNDGYQVARFAPALLLIGSDGGGEAYAFDLSELPWKVVRVPFVGMGVPDSAIPSGGNFTEFLKNLEH